MVLVVDLSKVIVKCHFRVSDPEKSGAEPSRQFLTALKLVWEPHDVKVARADQSSLKCGVESATIRHDPSRWKMLDGGCSDVLDIYWEGRRSDEVGTAILCP